MPHHECSRVPRKAVGTLVRSVPLFGAVSLLLLAAPPPADAQQAEGRAGAREVMYQREVYQYDRGGRADPFRPPLVTSEGGIRTADLLLRGVIYDADPRASVAILVERATQRRIRARVGTRIGDVRVVAIHPRRVDVVVEEMGLIRREFLLLRAESETDGPR